MEIGTIWIVVAIGALVVLAIAAYVVGNIFDNDEKNNSNRI